MTTASAHACQPYSHNPVPCPHLWTPSVPRDCLRECEPVAPSAVLSPGQWKAIITCCFQGTHGGPVTCSLRCVSPDLDKVCTETVTAPSYSSHSLASEQMYTKARHLDPAGLTVMCAGSSEEFWLPPLYLRAPLWKVLEHTA